MRPILLVIDPPDVEMISTRKLILESAKYNVLTATNTKEALEIATEIPVSAMVIHERLCDGEPGEITRRLKAARPSVPLWVVSPQLRTFPAADRVMSSFDPLALVKLAQETLGDPIDTKTGATKTDL